MCSAGGEEERVKPASELHKRSPGRTIYILEEPTYILDERRGYELQSCSVLTPFRVDWLTISLR